MKSDLFFRVPCMLLLLVIDIVMILMFANSIAMAGGFPNWCSINGPMAVSGLFILSLLFAFFVACTVCCINWTKYNLINSNK